MRSIWSGTISFGLVSVGVRMFPATESKELLERTKRQRKRRTSKKPARKAS